MFTGKNLTVRCNYLTDLESLKSLQTIARNFSLRKSVLYCQFFVSFHPPDKDLFHRIMLRVDPPALGARLQFPLVQNFFKKSLADSEKIKPAKFR